MKNHFTKSNIDSACTKINTQIYSRDRQPSILLKLDDISIFINQTITKRGIAKGLVKIQEDMNLTILEIEKLVSKMANENIDLFKEVEYLIKYDLWIDIRYLMLNRALTPGEMTGLLEKQAKINNELNKWAMSAKR